MRSLTLDGWNEKQLKMMERGGNHKLRLFFAEYDLLDESPNIRYKTIAAQYYRRRLRAEVFGEPFNESAPDFLEGKT